MPPCLSCGLSGRFACAEGGSVSKVLVDQGLNDQVVTHGAALGIDVEIVRRMARSTGGRRVNLNPLHQALGLREDAVRALADGLRTQIDAPQTQLHEAEPRLEHLVITRTTITWPSRRSAVPPCRLQPAPIREDRPPSRTA